MSRVPGVQAGDAGGGHRTVVGDAAADRERQRGIAGGVDAVRERKIGILERIAMDPGPFVDEREGAELQQLARREAAALRLGLSSRWGDASCL